MSYLSKFLMFPLQVNESCCPGSGSHPMIIFHIQLRRKSIYYDYIVISPTLNLCILTLVTFLLPCHHGDKIAIGLTVFLTLYVLQLLIAENVPDTNTTPILGMIGKVSKDLTFCMSEKCRYFIKLDKVSIFFSFSTNVPVYFRLNVETSHYTGTI